MSETETVIIRARKHLTDASQELLTELDNALSQATAAEARIRELEAALDGLLNTEWECSVCLGLSPSWDGHAVNPPCRGTAEIRARAVLPIKEPSDGAEPTREVALSDESVSTFNGREVAGREPSE